MEISCTYCREAGEVVCSSNNFFLIFGFLWSCRLRHFCWYLFIALIRKNNWTQLPSLFFSPPKYSSTSSLNGAHDFIQFSLVVYHQFALWSDDHPLIGVHVSWPSLTSHTHSDCPFKSLTRVRFPISFWALFFPSALSFPFFLNFFLKFYFLN